MLFLGGVLALPAWSAEVTTAPLRPPATHGGSTLFSVLAPEMTGIVADNPFADPKMWAERYQEFALGSMGTGVAAGDIDQDGDPDLFVVSKTGQSRLFRNLGEWKFEDITERAGLGLGALRPAAPTATGVVPVSGVEAWQHGATFADVNNDGWLDLYVCRYRAPNLLYMNQGNGTFREEAAARGLALVDASVIGAFCDYDRDGWLDVYVQTNMLDSVQRPTGQSDHLLRNRGDGTFEDVTARAGIKGDTLAHQTLWWDYNDDGWPDLYVTNDFAGADPLYHNNGDGTFTNVIHRAVPYLPYSSMGADLGDVNNDGRIDLFVADMASSTPERDMRGMASSRELLVDETGTEAPQYPRNALFLNTGVGRMLEVAQLAGLAATDWTWSVRFEDLDNDGRVDLHVTNGMNREYQNSDLRERIMTAENQAQRMQIMRSSPMMKERHFAFRNHGDLRFEEMGAAWGLDQVGVSFGAATADFDGDGDLDLVYANYEAAPTVLRNDGAKGERLLVALRGRRSNRFGLGASVRIETAAGVQVRTLQSTRGYISSSEPVAHFGLGDEKTVARLTVHWPSGFVQVLEAVPAGQRLVVHEPEGAEVPPGSAAVPPAADGAFSETAGGAPALRGKTGPAPRFVRLPASAGLDVSTAESPAQEPSTQALLPFRFNRRGPALAAADVDGDGRDELVVAGTSREPLRVLRRGDNGNYLAAALSRPESPLTDGPLLAFDADGDGDQDLFVTKSGTAAPAATAEYQPQLWLNDGQGQFAEAGPGVLPPVAISVGAVAAADFDRDGDLDLFVGGRIWPGRYPQTPPSVLLRNAGGRFETATQVVAPALESVGMVTSALWSDADNDGWVDLVLALEWGGVRCFRNVGGRVLTDASEALGFTTAGTGWWTAVAAADFNGDGRMDYALGNVGSNTPYQATSEKPALAFHGQFAKTGAPLLVEARYDGDKLVPRRTRNVLGARIPGLQQKYRRNDLYARASLADILGEPAVAAARRFAATQFQSGALMSTADGRFTFSPWPRLAQVAPTQGLVTGDFDGDGHADVYLVQNSYAPIASIGRFSAGLSQLLKGDGRGGFDLVEPAASGLIVPGDGKAAVAADLDDDGWADLVVTQNNGTTLAFRNRGTDGRPLRVDLRPAASRFVAGSRVQLELADGTRQTAEISRGSGYFSQSAATAWFGYPAANPPKRVHVRWSDGNETTTDVGGAGPIVTIK